MNTTIYTVGIGRDLTPEDLKALLPEHLHSPMRLGIIDIRRPIRSRNHSWDDPWAACESWASYFPAHELANAKDAPVGERSWIPCFGQDKAEYRLTKLANVLLHPPQEDIALVLLCQCRELEVRYKRDGRLKAQCHRKPVAEELAQRTSATVVHLGGAA